MESNMNSFIIHLSHNEFIRNQIEYEFVYNNTSNK